MRSVWLSLPQFSHAWRRSSPHSCIPLVHSFQPTHVSEPSLSGSHTFIHHNPIFTCTDHFLPPILPYMYVPSLPFHPPHLPSAMCSGLLATCGTWLSNSQASLIYCCIENDAYPKSASLLFSQLLLLLLLYVPML